MIDYMSFSIDEARRYGRVCALPAEYAGISVWALPLSPNAAERKATDKSDFIRKMMGAGALRTYSDICTNMAQQTKTVTEKTDWYLSIAGVHPAHQGKGLGPQLILPVLEEADATGVATYLETFSKRNMPFYERLGYRTLAAFEESVTGATYRIMRRAPRR